MKVMPTAVSPSAVAFAGAAPDLVQLLEVVEALLLAHQLDDRGEQRVGGAGGVRVGDLDLILELRIEKVGPAFRLGELLAGDLLGVEPVAERARIDADGAALRLLPLPHRPVVELGEPRRCVFVGEALLGGLHVRIASAAPPDVGAGIGGLGLDLGVDLARALAGHRHLDAGLALEGRRRRPAPLLLDGAVEHERALRARLGGKEKARRRDRGVDEGAWRHGDPPADVGVSFAPISGFCGRRSIPRPPRTISRSGRPRARAPSG
jgi:hypothetical protein